jgi:hypothetical protein
MAKKQIEVAALRHSDKRRNIPTAELEPVMRDEEKTPKPVRYARNLDLDPQLVWRGKDEQDWSDRECAPRASDNGRGVWGRFVCKHDRLQEEKRDIHY